MKPWPLRVRIAMIQKPVSSQLIKERAFIIQKGEKMPRMGDKSKPLSGALVGSRNCRRLGLCRESAPAPACAPARRGRLGE